MINKILTIILGFFRKGGEAIIDSNAIHLSEEQIRQAKDSIKESESSLVGLMTKLKLEERKSSELTQKINEHMANARSALEKDNAALAKKCTDEISRLTNEKATVDKIVSTYTKNIESINASIKDNKALIKNLEVRKDQAQANQDLIKANAAIANNYAGTTSAVSSVSETLDRLEAQQAEKLARFDVAKEYSAQNDGSSLERELREANITSGDTSSDALLAQLQKELSDKRLAESPNTNQ
ncbi:PspA/IM30 family protein [Pseudomonas luteola]